MAASYHTRSNSFPSTTTPFVSRFDEQLSRIKSSELASSSSSSTITSKISILGDLYDCVDELLQLPSSQTAFSCQSAEDVLEGSIKLLDSCNTISEVLSQMKEKSQQLQSILRRRCSKEEIAQEVAQYLKSRKTAIKVVSKTLKDLKKIENAYAAESNEITNIVIKLKECQMVTCNVLQSVLVAVAGSKATRSWDSVVSKVLKSKRVSNQQCLLVEEGLVNIENMEIMEMSIKNVEESVKNLFRHLIKTRTTLLNIITC